MLQFTNMAPFFKEVRQTIDYLFEENRRKTFKKWVFSDNDICNADKMAEAGFIFIGSRTDPDSVKCFFCKKPLDGWDPTDCPWQEHLKHSPNCSYAKLQKPLENLTLEQILDIKTELLRNIIESYYKKQAEWIKEKFEEFEEEIELRLDDSSSKRL